jgi:pyruvate/2-oxoglutarate dehydrogenase complex dihydrolipoamide acyltransferase (E2) component
MLFKLTVPGPIEDVDELRVLEWHGDVGHRFAAGALIVELETHKAVVEVRAAQPGVLRQMLREPGSWSKPGETLAVLSDAPDEPLPSSPEALRALAVEFEVS